VPSETVPAPPPALALEPDGPPPALEAPEEELAASPRPRLRLASSVARTSALALFGYVCMFHLSVVRGSSMAPRIHDGDRILIDPISYLFHQIQRSDIVVLRYPLDPSVDYIKRVIGLPGDEVVLERGRVWVNGEELAEPYVGEADDGARLSVRVKSAHYFVLGDNRRRSCDSREFGQVPVGYVRGKVEVRVWPPQRMGRIDAGALEG
jgi:signal peptidase I